MPSPQTPRPLKQVSDPKPSTSNEKIKETPAKLPSLTSLKSDSVSSTPEEVEKLCELDLNDNEVPVTKIPAKPESQPLCTTHITLAKDKKWIPIFIHEILLPSHKTEQITMFVTPVERMTELFDYLEHMTSFYQESADFLHRIELKKF